MSRENCPHCEKTYKVGSGGLSKHIAKKHKDIQEQPLPVVEAKPDTPFNIDAFFEENKDIIEEQGINKNEIELTDEEIRSIPGVDSEEFVLRRNLQNEMRDLYLNNPGEIDLNKKVCYNYEDKIANMSNGEIRMRIFEANNKFGNKLDKRLSNAALNIASNGIGRLLGIGNDLTEMNAGDELLKSSLNHFISHSLGLSTLSPMVKTGILMGGNMATCFIKKQQQQASRRATLRPVPTKEEAIIMDVEEKVEQLQNNYVEPGPVDDEKDNGDYFDNSSGI